MNLARIWILRLSAVCLLAYGASLLYDASQDFSWGRRALAESNRREWTEIAAESTEKNRDGNAALANGLLFIAAALVMDGVAAVIKPAV